MTLRYNPLVAQQAKVADAACGPRKVCEAPRSQYKLGSLWKKDSLLCAAIWRRPRRAASSSFRSSPPVAEDASWESVYVDESVLRSPAEPAGGRAGRSYSTVEAGPFERGELPSRLNIPACAVSPHPTRPR